MLKTLYEVLDFYGLSRDPQYLIKSGDFRTAPDVVIYTIPVLSFIDAARDRTEYSEEKRRYFFRLALENYKKFLIKYEDWKQDEHI